MFSCQYRLLTGIPEVAQAQYKAPGSDDPFPSNEQDSLTGGAGGFDPMTLIHNANLSRSRSGGEFAEDTQRSLGDAAEQFKLLQQQQLQEVNQDAFATPDPGVAPAPDQPVVE